MGLGYLPAVASREARLLALACTVAVVCAAASGCGGDPAPPDARANVGILADDVSHLQDRWLRRNFAPIVAVLRQQSAVLADIVGATDRRDRSTLRVANGQLARLVYEHDERLHRFNAALRRRPYGDIAIQAADAPLRP
jgi:hypothetical protein